MNQIGQKTSYIVNGNVHVTAEKRGHDVMVSVNGTNWWDCGKNAKDAIDELALTAREYFPDGKANTITLAY